MRSGRAPRVLGAQHAVLRALALGARARHAARRAVLHPTHASLVVRAASAPCFGDALARSGQRRVLCAGAGLNIGHVLTILS